VSKQHQERKNRSFDEHYDKISDEQFEVIYSLTKLGASLWFVRVENDQPYAVLKSSDGLIGVDHKGEVLVNPNITLREEKIQHNPDVSGEILEHKACQSKMLYA
jgi:hypothetical protein